jgi:hypothetical protein
MLVARGALCIGCRAGRKRAAWVNTSHACRAARCSCHRLWRCCIPAWRRRRYLDRGVDIDHTYTPQRPDDGAGDQPAADATKFELDTAQVVIRCLTARAVQRVLLQLESVDTFTARWLNTYCGAHPPLEGDKVGGIVCLELGALPGGRRMDEQRQS